MFYSKDIVRYAVEKGWYVPKTTDYSDFDFQKITDSDVMTGIVNNANVGSNV